MGSMAGAMAAFEACDLAKYGNRRLCEVWFFRCIEEGAPKRDDHDLWPREALAVDVTIRRAARWYELERSKP